MSACLITGATGLIGRHAVAALVEAGVTVHAVARKGPATTLPGVTWHTGDLLDPAFVESLCHKVKATHLLHLAWVTEHGAFWTSADNRLWQDATEHLVRCFQASGGMRVVSAGSCAEYDWSALGEDGVCREDVTPIRPQTLYGQVKAATHDWLRAFAAETGLGYAWGRIFWLFGEGENPDRLVPAVALSLARGQEAKCSSGKQVRDYMDARDVGSAFAALALSDVSGAVNVASGEGRSIAEIATLVAKAMGRSDLLRLGALPDRPGEPPIIVADVKKLRDEVGFVPRLSLEQGLAEICALLKSQSVDAENG